MATIISFQLGAVTVAWDTAEDLDEVLAKAGFVQTVLASQTAAVERAPQRPAGPTRNPQPVDEGTPGERPRTPEQAEARFWKRYGEVIGGQSWPAVQRYLGRLDARPQSVDGWIAVAEEVRDRQRQSAA
jgi:hypothetical protein